MTRAILAAALTLTNLGLRGVAIVFAPFSKHSKCKCRLYCFWLVECDFGRFRVSFPQPLDSSFLLLHSSELFYRFFQMLIADNLTFFWGGGLRIWGSTITNLGLFAYIFGATSPALLPHAVTRP